MHPLPPLQVLFQIGVVFHHIVADIIGDAFLKTVERHIATGFFQPAHFRLREILVFAPETFRHVEILDDGRHVHRGIDGARQIRIFVQIVLPISLPAIATIGLFFTFAYWNDWLMAKYYLNSNMQDLFPLQYVLITLENSIDFLSRNSQFMAPGETSNIPSETVRMAMVMIAVVPIACSYPFFQKYFISGLTIGAVKG